MAETSERERNWTEVRGLEVGWGEGASRKCCWKCAAGFNETHNVYDFSLQAAWRRARVTMPEFWEAAACQQQYVSSIWSVPGFHLESIKLGWMHIADLGILQYLVANCLWECFQELGGTFTSSRTACSQLMNIIIICCRVIAVEKPINALTVIKIQCAL